MQHLVHAAHHQRRWLAQSNRHHPPTVNFPRYSRKPTPQTCRTAPRHRPRRHTTRRPHPYDIGEAAGESSKNYFPRKSWRDHRTTSDNMLFPAVCGRRRLLDNEIVARLLDPRTRSAYASFRLRAYRSNLGPQSQNEKFSPSHSP